MIIDIIYCAEGEYQEIYKDNVFEGVNDAHGVIGLGFFNTISNYLFFEKSKKMELNILSYSLINQSEVELIFGYMTEEQIKSLDLDNKNFMNILLKTLPYWKEDFFNDINYKEKVKNELLKDSYSEKDILITFEILKNNLKD